MPEIKLPDGSVRQTTGAPVLIDYTNHRGQRTLRRIYPFGMFWGHTEWHPEDQWLVPAYDIDRGVWRHFAMNHIHEWKGAEADRDPITDPRRGDEVFFAEDGDDTRLEILHRVATRVTFRRWCDGDGSAPTTVSLSTWTSMLRERVVSWRRAGDQQTGGPA